MASAPSAPYRLIGSRIPYVEGPLKVTGRGGYTDDIHRPGELDRARSCEAPGRTPGFDRST